MYSQKISRSINKSSENERVIPLFNGVIWKLPWSTNHFFRFVSTINRFVPPTANRRFTGGLATDLPCKNNRSGLADCLEAAYHAIGPEMCHWGCVDSDNATGAITRIVPAPFITRIT